MEPIFFKTAIILPTGDDREEGSGNGGDREREREGEGGSESDDAYVNGSPNKLSADARKAKEAQEEFFRVSNLRLDLEEEKQVTGDLKKQLSNCERDLETALVKLKAERDRMDDQATRDQANETKFTALQQTLDLLVSGETKKSIIC
jgi:type I site-specific restriction endonuclease